VAIEQPSVHLICNAHMDPVWLWLWQEGAAAAISTFRTAARLCEEFDGFVFNHNEVILYKWVQQYEPALFKQIQRLVKAGRWNIMGGWYLQPDCNMPSGESFVRQILLGKSSTPSGTRGGWCRYWQSRVTTLTCFAGLLSKTARCLRMSSCGSGMTVRRCCAAARKAFIIQSWARRRKKSKDS